MSTPFVNGNDTDIWNSVLKDNYNIFAKLLTAVGQSIILPSFGMNGVRITIVNFDPSYIDLPHLDLPVLAPDVAYHIPGDDPFKFANVNIFDLTGNAVRVIYIPYGKAAEFIGVGENDNLYCWKLLSLS